MKKKYAVATNPMSVAQNESLIDYIKQKDLAWWHWIGNFWLLIDYNEKVDCISLRDDLSKLFPGLHFIILDVTTAGSGWWGGFGPNAGDKNMFEWLENTWDAPD